MNSAVRPSCRKIYSYIILNTKVLIKRLIIKETQKSNLLGKVVKNLP